MLICIYEYSQTMLYSTIITSYVPICYRVNLWVGICVYIVTIFSKEPCWTKRLYILPSMHLPSFCPQLCSYFCFLILGSHLSRRFLPYKSCFQFFWQFCILSYLFWFKKNVNTLNIRKYSSKNIILLAFSEFTEQTLKQDIVSSSVTVFVLHISQIYFWTLGHLQYCHFELGISEYAILQIQLKSTVHKSLCCHIWHLVKAVVHFSK